MTSLIDLREEAEDHRRLGSLHDLRGQVVLQGRNERLSGIA